MATFWVIFNRRERTGKQQAGQVFENATVSPAKAKGEESAPYFSGQLEEACLIKVEGASLAVAKEAVRAVQHFYPGLSNGNTMTVLAANAIEPTP